MQKDSRLANLEAILPKPKAKKELEKISRRKTDRARISEANTIEEKELVRQKIKLSQAKSNLTRATKNIKKLAKEENIPAESVPNEILTELELDQETVIIFKPNKGPQEEFLSSSEDEVFYGGARGGGKTYVLIIDPLRECHNSNHRALFIRRTMPELRDIIHTTKLLYPKAYPGAKWKEQDKVWNFPSGARIEFGYAETVNDALRYQGQSYTWIGFDELPQYPDAEVYNFIKSSLRSTDPTLKEYLRATGNPGNIGSGWVKEEFIDPAPSNTTFYREVSYFNPILNKQITKTVSRKFIPAKVWDNPYLVHNDRYVATLASLPEAQRKQFLEGDWNVVKGAAFPEFNRPEGTHVIEPFKIPNSWYRFRAADWGYSSPFCCLWFAVDFDGNLYVYREYYGKGVIADTWAVNVAKMEKQERVWYGVIDGSTDIRRGETGPSIYETINTEIKANGSVPFRFADRSPGSRAAGKQEVHKRLALRPNGLLDKEGNDILKPSLYVFNTCVNLIRTLPMLPLDKLDQEKVEKKSEDHAYDALHYGLRSRPINPAQMLDVNRFREQNMPKPADNTFGY